MIRALKFLGLCQPYREALISSIIRVDHAGELGADRIYAGQSKVLGKSEVGAVIQEMWDEEKEHLEITERLMTKHQVAPTIIMPLFKAMAFGLGVSTAMISKEGAMACTIAVEELIGQHYNDQIRKLMELGVDDADNRELLSLIKKMRDDELHHHDTGIEHDGLRAPSYQTLKSVIQAGCKAAIYTAERV